MTELKSNSSKEIKLKNILARLHCTVQQMGELSETQNRYFSILLHQTQNYLNAISSTLQFLHDEHIKDYRKFTIKKAQDEAKQWRRENEY